jgi:hypothetical protein
VKQERMTVPETPPRGHRHPIRGNNTANIPEGRQAPGFGCLPLGVNE